jgi:isopentenyl phosphate kinase
MFLVKLGGSVITVKGEGHYLEPRPDAMRRLAAELAPHAKNLVLVHGAGSYGHTLAAKHALRQGHKDGTQLAAVGRVQRDVRVLNTMVLGVLHEAGIPASPVAPSDVARYADGVPEKFHSNPFEDYLRLGMVPVTFGDVVRDTKRGFTIASGDDLLLDLAKAFRPDLTVAVTSSDGVYTANPKTVEGAQLLERADTASLDSIDFNSFGGGDATGSMREKLEKMVQVAVHTKRTLIIGDAPGRLAGALAGRDVRGTVVVGG